MRRITAIRATMAIAVLLAAPPAGAAERGLKPTARPAAITGLPTKLTTEISGIACGPPRAGVRGCLLAFDEKRAARFVTYADGRFTLGPTIEILAEKTTDPKTGATVKNKEADLEGASRDGDTYWLIGSHSTKRRDDTGTGICPLEPGRRHVYRFDVDPTTDLPSFDFAADDPAKEIRRIDRLPVDLAKVPELAGPIDATICGDAGGFNIEGGAVSGGRMVLGVRSPLFGGAALLVELDAAALAADLPQTPTAEKVDLGSGNGVRDITAVAGGHLILAGPSASDDGTPRPPSSLWFRSTGGGDPTFLGELLDVDPMGKPEALAVLDTLPKAWRVLVLSDGAAGGAPREYEVPRP